MKRIEVRCSTCGRRRKVSAESMAGKVWERTKQTWRDKLWLRCITCKLLDSIYKHERAIQVLYKRVEDRRMRGL